MDIQEILDMWEVDGVIDQFKLDDTTIKNATLHSKYLSLITVAKLKKKQKELEYNAMLKNKWLYYNGKLSQAQIDAFGWEYDPFGGLHKPLKGEMNYYYDADSDIQKFQAEMEYHKVMVDTIKEILDTIRWRHQTIGNIIKWRQFESGV
jgi:hypothetical protein